MNHSILNKLKILEKRYLELELLLSKIDISSNQNNFIKLSQEHSKLTDIIMCFRDWKLNKKEVNALNILLYDKDLSEMANEEIKILLKKSNILENNLNNLLLPNDPNDNKSCFIEIRAATGGKEAAIFAGDLFKMYARYSELCHWKIEIMSRSEGEQGGFKEIIAKIKGKGVSGRLKFESGGHRVQRIPQTETQGRTHTSTCTVAIMPIASHILKININASDLKIDTFRSSGAGGQHVNTTDSAIRITHIPTGSVVECQDERSQHKNKAKALSILSARIEEMERSKLHEKNANIRRNLLGSGFRSDRNRTYNFPQNRITDHRINLTLYRLDEILEGNLDLLIHPIIQEYQADMLSNLSKKNV
ncbi:protein chain release factor A [Buchnera aphidicola (Nipponaphis monzeni)]|uniref:Peptide chain release factor 1 n=1 Tax=Buchnera aphidicola (Nipponaphis monzeni) TaxID=2495405 RepID=A0A455T9Z7_9GAMM|nr:peptide chain release factor 1 [Buchnera aphidicola]BBI01152.1 protein chain release factor A [Buchnera aphidicola (Nipponaphis monzeni)]